MDNICINCIHKDVCYKYRLNYVVAREGTCINYYEIPKVDDWIEKKVPVGYDYGDVKTYKRFKEADNDKVN